MRYKTITSPSNPLVKEALRVIEGKDRRSGQRHAVTLLIEGHRLIEMALASGAAITRVFFTEAYRSRHGGFLKRLSEKGSGLIETTEHILSRMAETETPQGIVAMVSFGVRKLRELSLKSSPLIVVCDAIQDPGNIGTIIRTADAAGVDAVIILPGTCDVFMPKAVRATAGSLFNLPILFSEKGALIEWLGEKAVRILVADVHATRTLYEADLKGPIAFVFGNEAGGVSKDLKEAGELLRIPVLGRAESLNVAMSAAVCLYEAIRQRTMQP